MNNERIPSTIKFFFSLKHLESSLHWWIGSENSKMVLIFSAKSTYVDHDQKLEIIIFRR
jgi:hypothetical protein